MEKTSAHKRSQSLGNLTVWKKEPWGISGETENAKFRLQYFSDTVVRVSATRTEAFDDFSYAMVAEPVADGFSITDGGHELRISTSAFITVIRKHPVRITFLHHDESVINEDDPAFGIAWNGDQVTNYKKLQDGERFVGLGEKTGGLDRRGSGYQNWNTDNFGYGNGSDPLYCATPFYIGVHHHKCYGIFFDNTYKSFFNFGASNNRFASFSADAGDMNYYFMAGGEVASIIRDYTHLTGRMEMPPKWSIGYQQCRYSYYPDKEVRTLAQTFRDKDIPADVIVFDIHYMEQYKIFTWSQRDFPDPAALIKELRALGFRIVVMCDPGIKVEEGYHAYESGKQQGVFIQYPDGTNYTGQVWPGWCHFPDFTNPKTRTWWQEQFKDYVALGIQGFWNDMNEIATWGNQLPENIEMDFDGDRSSMRRGRNIYGFQMARSTYEGTKSLLKGRRPFNLTRSAYSGIQRYAAVWTGDNVAYEEHMLLGVRMINSMGLTGIAFAGYDVGGFVGDASTKLFARWMSIGAFSPFFRGHSMINSRDAEPWSFGEEVEQISRNYIKLRYQLLPYIYSLFYEATQTGMPVQRSLSIYYPHDYKIYDGQFYNQYLFGPSLLIAPEESGKQFVKVYFPQGEWYSLYDGTRFGGNTEVVVECALNKLPVYVKAGAIIPMQPAISNVGETADILFLHVYAGANGVFTLYDDDGDTFSYQQDKFHLRTITLQSEQRTLTLSAAQGSFDVSWKKLKVIFHHLSADHASVNNHDASFQHEMNRFMQPLEKFDPIKDPEPAPEEPVRTITIDYDPREIVVRW